MFFDEANQKGSRERVTLHCPCWEHSGCLQGKTISEIRLDTDQPAVSHRCEILGPVHFLFAIRSVAAQGAALTMKYRTLVMYMEIGCFVSCLCGWILVCSTLPTEYWTFSEVGSIVLTTSNYYSNLWRDCISDTTGVSDCKDYPSMLALPGRNSGVLSQSTARVYLTGGATLGFKISQRSQTRIYKRYIVFTNSNSPRAVAWPLAELETIVGVEGKLNHEYNPTTPLKSSMSNHSDVVRDTFSCSCLPPPSVSSCLPSTRRLRRHHRILWGRAHAHWDEVHKNRRVRTRQLQGDVRRRSYLPGIR